jgi:hypothetical protein
MTFLLYYKLLIPLISLLNINNCKEGKTTGKRGVISRIGNSVLSTHWIFHPNPRNGHGQHILKLKRGNTK